MEAEFERNEGSTPLPAKKCLILKMEDVQNTPNLKTPWMIIPLKHLYRDIITEKLLCFCFAPQPFNDNVF